jgi:hypothetical protein
LKLKADENCEGNDTFVLPRPTIPLALLARPFCTTFEPQMNKKLGTETNLPE